MNTIQDPEAAETVQTTSVPAVDLPRLVGLLVFAGDLEINGEEISGCAVDIDRATLIAAKSLPMYERCVIVTAAELQKMEDVIDAAKCIRHWHDREPDGMIVSAEHVRKLWAALHDLEANSQDH
jgi:malate synthase